MPLPDRTYTAQNGNVFAFILLGVILFAALVFTFTRGLDTGTTQMTTAEARTHASDIIQTGAAFERAVQHVIQNGVSENDVSFENGLVTGYAHAPAVAAGAQIFDATSGGGMTYKGLLPGETPSTSNIWLFTGAIVITGQESDSRSDLIASLPVSVEVCREINKQLDNSIDIDSTVGTITGAKFTGTYADNAAVFMTPGTGLAQGCVMGLITNGAQSGGYTYFKVLLAR